MIISALDKSSKKRTAASFMALSAEEWEQYQKHLKIYEEYEPYELAGSIGVRGDILDSALKICTTFQQVCKSIFVTMQSDDALKQNLFRALHSIPVTKAAIESSPFFLQYLRMDFFLDLKNERLRIIEVNSSGAGLSDYIPCIQFLQNFHSFTTPKGSLPLAIHDPPSCFIEYCTKHRPKMHTLGLVAMENGCTDYIIENKAYGNWLTENTTITPVYLALNAGTLSVLDHPRLPNTITDLAEVDAVLVDFFEDLECLERVQKQLDALGVFLVPPRSDILFENKHFLNVLQTIQKPATINADDWNLLQDALLPSFPLEEHEQYRELMQEWKGIVLKMDIDCCGENVHLFDFTRTPFAEVLITLQQKKQESAQAGVTYTIQQLIHPPHIPLQNVSPPWVDIDYAPYKFDLMTYLCMRENTPHVLFGSRCFSREKVDELTQEGREDALGGPICRL